MRMHPTGIGLAQGWLKSWALTWLMLLLGAGCATGRPPPSGILGNFRYRSLTPPEHPETKERRERSRTTKEAHAPVEATEAGSGPSGQSESEEEGTEGWAGWRDGIGPGHPYAVPMSLDYFQGFLQSVGVPCDALPGDGRTLSAEQALGLLPHLLGTPVTLGNFGPRRMAAHLLLEVATGSEPVSRDTLHARMRRFTRLRVLCLDGYLVEPMTGRAEQKAGEVFVAEDGTLRAGRFEVGPFYAIEDGRFYPVDMRLEVAPGALPTGRYEPDDGVMLPVAEGAALAVVDMVEGLYRLVFHTGDTLEGLVQLPGVVRELYANAPEHWDAFRHKPYAERVRAVSRLVTGALVVGTSGAGAAKAASWGGKLGHLSVPLLSLSGDGLMAVRVVAVPAGAVVTMAAPALSATYVLHMANTGAQGAAGGGNSSGDISVKDAHVNVPKHNLSRLAPTWAEQRQILVDTLRKVDRRNVKEIKYPEGIQCEIAVRTSDMSGNIVTLNIRWFEFIDGRVTINTAFIPP